MPSIWINSDHRVAFSSNLLADLDIYKLMQHFTHKKTADITSWIQKHLTSDVKEMSRRNRIVQAFSSTPVTANQCRRLHHGTRRLQEAYMEMKRAQNPLVRCTTTIDLLKLYVTEVHEVCECLKSIPALEDECTWIEQHMNSQAFSAIQQCTERVSSVFKPLSSITICVNVQGNGDAVSLQILDITDQDISTISFLESPPCSINSLLPLVSTKNRNDIVHLEAFLISQVERQWRNCIARVKKEFRDVPFNMIDEWLEAMNPLEFYVIALTFTEEMCTAGCSLCIPEPDENEFRMEDLCSPHFVIEGKAMSPYSERLNARKSTLITGANHAGKTTFMKTVAQCCLLAQLGFLIPAKSFSFPAATSMHSVFAVGEQENMRQSRFEQERRSLQEALDYSDTHSLVWINEPYTSTNPIEAVPLLCDALRVLQEKGVVHWCVTHLYELYESLIETASTVQSLVVERSDTAMQAPVIKITKKPPDGINFARILVRQFGLNADQFIKDPVILKEIENFLVKEDA